MSRDPNFAEELRAMSNEVEESADEREHLKEDIDSLTRGYDDEEN